ncbi:MAG: TraR/DksA family transcriptional regulator [Gammaproteobacteria bacterium]
MANPISQDQLSNFRNQLKQRQSRLRAGLQQQKSIPERTDSDSQDIELSYVSDQEQQVDEGINQQHLLELREIEAALQRMDAGHYGVCQDCGAPIGIKRLTAYPEARRCIDCKQALEQASANTRSN